MLSGNNIFSCPLRGGLNGRANQQESHALACGVADKIRPALKKDKNLTLKVISHTMRCVAAKAKKQRIEAVHRLFELGEVLSDEDYKFLISEALAYLWAHNFDIAIKEVRRMRSARAQTREKETLSYWDICNLKMAAKGHKEGHKEGHKTGIKQGREQALREVAINLLHDMTPKKVAARTKLPLAQVLKLKKQKARRRKV